MVTFLLAHPNVYVVNSMDTRVPMHLRAPSTSPSEERMYDTDREWYEYFDSIGKGITGYERAGDVYQDYGRGNPLFGHGPDFGYWYYGAIWYGDELWNGGRFKDYDGDDDIDQLDLLRWDDEENGGDGFIEWKPATHPVYGEVEIGGFHPKFFSQNAPSKHLLPWAKNQALFNLEMVNHLPSLAWGDVVVEKTESFENDSADYQITISFKNRGKLPTALKQAHLVKIVREDQITIEFEDEVVKGENPVLKILQEEEGASESRYWSFRRSPRYQTSASADCGFTPGGETNKATFNIRIYQKRDVNCTISISSTRGGVLNKKLSLDLNMG